MNTLVLVLVVMATGSVEPAIHSLKYFYTASSGVRNFPEFVTVGMVDDVQMVHFDSNSRKTEPKQEWMNKVSVDDPRYWERNTQNFVGDQQVYKVNIQTAKQRFNQTGDVHMFQLMYGCDWDDETGEVVDGFSQFSYDGEDFIAFDLKTSTWIAPTPQAVITKHRWDADTGYNDNWKDYLTQICPEWGKKYLTLGGSVLLRTERPRVSFLQRSSSSPVTCHATGFYPNSADMFWRKDGEQLHEDVDVGEILPNPDGTFQMSVDLKVADTDEDLGRYECVFQLAGVKEDDVHRLNKESIRSNEKKDRTVLIVAAVVIVALVVVGVLGFVVYRKKNDKRPPSPADTSDVLEELNPRTQDAES